MEFSKKRCLKTNKNEVAKKPKVRRTKGNIRVVHVRRHAKNKNEVAKKQELGGTEREPYLTFKPILAKKQKGEKFGKKRNSKNNKNEVGKKQKVRSIEAELRLMYKKKGLKMSKYARWIPIPHTCDCYKMHLKFLENASKEKEELEADIDSDVAT